MKSLTSFMSSASLGGLSLGGGGSLMDVLDLLAGGGIKGDDGGLEEWIGGGVSVVVTLSSNGSSLSG